MTLEERIAKSIVNYLTEIPIKKSNKKSNFYSIPINVLATHLKIKPQEISSNKEIMDKLGLEFIKKETNSDYSFKDSMEFQESGSRNQFLSALDCIIPSSKEERLSSNSIEYNKEDNKIFLKKELSTENLKDNPLNCEELGIFSMKNQSRIEIKDINKFVLNTVNFIGIDKIINVFDWKNFEGFISDILMNIGYKTITNFRFSIDKNSKKKISTFTSKTTKKKQKRFEIDVIGFYNNMILMIDAKLWKNSHDNFSNLSTASKFQMERARILSEDNLAINKMFSSLGIKGPRIIYDNGLNINMNMRKSLKKIWIYPIIIQAGFSEKKISHYGVPVVSLSEISDFFTNFKSYSSSFVRYKIKNLEVQSKLI